MAVTLETAARNAACNAVVDLVDVGASPAWLELDDSAYNILVLIYLPNPSFGAASTGVATAAGLPLTATCIAPGTMSKYRVFDRSGTSTQVWEGTIGLSGSGADMIVDAVAIVAGQAISITSWTHTHPA